VRQAFLPVFGDQAAVADQGLYVTGQRQRDHIGVNAVNDRTGLLARAAVRLLDAHVLAGLGLPVFGKRDVVVHIKLACLLVRYIEQRHGRMLAADPVSATANATRVETFIKWRRVVMICFLDPVAFACELIKKLNSGSIG